MNAGRPPERPLWSGRPALRLLVLSPTFLGPAAAAAWLANRALVPGRLPAMETLQPWGMDTLRHLTPACFELLAAAVIAATLAWIVLTRITVRYELTNQRLRLSGGVLIRIVDEIELYRVRDVQLRRGPLQRLSGLGTVSVDSTDGTGAIRIGPIAGSAWVRESIREASEAQKAAMGMRVVA